MYQQQTNPQGPTSTGLDVKDLAAILPVFTAIFTYLTYVRARVTWIKKKRTSVGPLGTLHWWIDWLPNKILTAVSLLATLSSFAYFVVRTLGTQTLGGPLAGPLKANYDYFYYIFLVWLAFAILAHFNALARVFAAIAWVVPAARRTIGFANASWHIEHDAEASAVALSMANRQFAESVIKNVATTNPNPNLALRPSGVSDDEAANILYFGHVIEESYGLVHSAAHIGWTKFYELMGALASEPERPLSSAAVQDFNGKSFFYETIKKYDSYAANAGMPRLSDSQELEESIVQAFALLRSDFQGDARRIGHRRLFGPSYGAALRNSRTFLRKEEMRMQFAKLAIVWGLWRPRVATPATFRIPFSAGILRLLLTEHQLRTDAKELDTADWRVRACFEEAQERLLLLAFNALEKTDNPQVTQWRDARRSEVQGRGLDWRWYVFYRVDQHIYHMSRNDAAFKWEQTPGTALIAKRDD